MSVHIKTNYADVNERWQVRFYAVRAALQTAMSTWGMLVKRRAISLSNGPLKLDTLRKIKPGLYSSVSSGEFSFDSVINNQSSTFLNAWQTKTGRVGNIIATTVINNSEHAKYMYGTKRMRIRPVLDRAIKEVPPLYAALVAAKQKAESL